MGVGVYSVCSCRSRFAINPCIRAMLGWSTSGFFQLSEAGWGEVNLILETVRLFQATAWMGRKVNIWCHLSGSIHNSEGFVCDICNLCNIP